MTKEEFLEKFSKEVLQLDYILAENTLLIDIEAWDSLAQITTVSFFDKEFNISLSFDTVQNVDTLLDIWKKIPIK